MILQNIVAPTWNIMEYFRKFMVIWIERQMFLRTLYDHDNPGVGVLRLDSYRSNHFRLGIDFWSIRLIK